MKTIDNYIQEKLHIGKDYKNTINNFKDMIEYLESKGIICEKTHSPFSSSAYNIYLSKNNKIYIFIGQFDFSKVKDYHFYIFNGPVTESEGIIVNYYDDEHSYDNDEIGLDFDKENKYFKSSKNTADKLIEILNKENNI